MKRESRILIAVIGILAIILGAGYIGIFTVSGLDSPLSVVTSSSMQHDNNLSQIGVIDTGDVMVIQSPSKVEIQSYVEGTVSGLKMFGDYGHVIVYNRGDDVNPVIHRAIIWLDYNAKADTWSAPSLADYKGSWSCTGSTSYLSLSGTLTFHGITQFNKTVSINLGTLGKQSGYLTMGDNPSSNTYFDQAVGIISHPIGNDDIRSMPIMEIPWMGVLKVYMTDNKRPYLSHVPNSIVCLVMMLSTVIGLIYSYDIFYIRKKLAEDQRKLEDNPYY